MLVTNITALAYDILCIIGLFTWQNYEISYQVPYNILIV